MAVRHRRHANRSRENQSTSVSKVEEILQNQLNFYVFLLESIKKVLISIIFLTFQQGSAVTIDSELLTRDRADTCDTLPNQDTSDTLPHQQSSGSHMSSNRLGGDQVSGQHVDNENSNNLNNASSGCFDLITDKSSQQSGVSPQSCETEKSNVASQNQKPKIDMMKELRRARSRHHEQYLKRCQTEEVEARKAREAEEKLEEEKRLEAEKRLTPNFHDFKSKPSKSDRFLIFFQHLVKKIADFANFKIFRLSFFYIILSSNFLKKLLI